jgi:hypothetical protein
MNIIDDLKATIALLETQIKVIQSACSHPDAAKTTVNRGDTGNYNPHDDHYWSEHKCNLCQKEWTTDQGTK